MKRLPFSENAQVATPRSKNPTESMASLTCRLPCWPVPDPDQIGGPIGERPRDLVLRHKQGPQNPRPNPVATGTWASIISCAKLSSLRDLVVFAAQKTRLTSSLFLAGAIMAMAMTMTVASPQALLAVSTARQIGTLRHCAVALPPLRSKAALPRRLVVVRATSQVDAGSAASSKAIVPDTEVSITKTSFGTIGLVVGTALLSYGFGAYFTVLPGSEWSALMLTYGFPLSVIGFALKYAELKPVPCTTYEDAFKVRDAQATEILAQVRSDVTRFRYGDEQHLEEALKRIFRYGQAGGITRRYAPILQSIREEVRGQGRYCLTLIFEAKNLKLSDFEDRQPKFQSFFGPGVVAEIASGEGEHMYEVRLIAQDPAAASA
ncbi:hypothetical protein KC19_1G261400 [Ceratodon purpureus]|uniref:Thylakoid membrane protein slr0575 n=1 Tax=Ceratodon purpureus TaxID=3225 RepID=A0A8T0JBX2_CERPU|nr:hypothetical protein KC19_1G261400 [Ceratodon purpureus]